MPQVQYLAVGGDPDHHGVLGSAALEHWKAIAKLLTQGWSDPQERGRLARMAGCLDKLSAALLQVERLRQHHDRPVEIAKRNRAPAGSTIALRGIEVLADFEGLLLQGRAALDRLTWFVTSDLGPKTDSFRRLRNVAADFVAKRPEASALLGVLDIAEPWFDALFAKIASPEALRDLVGHKHSLAEGVETCFAVTHVSPEAALLLDCEVRLPGSATPTPILEAARAAGQFLSYTTLNSVGIFAGRQPLEPDAFAPTWKLSTVARCRFLVDEPDGAPLGDHTLFVARRMTPDGFEMTHRNYRSELWNHAIRLNGRAG